MHMHEDKTLEEVNSFAGAQYKAIWLPAPFYPEENIAQVSALCINEAQEYLLVSHDGVFWQIAGGHPESNETPMNALAREIKEETCCDLMEATYLGSRKVINLENNEIHYQLRYFARVQTNPFHPNDEMRYLKSVKADAFLTELSYGKTIIAQELFRLSENLRLSPR